MTIEVPDTKYRFYKADDLNWVVEEQFEYGKKSKRAGEMGWRNVSYHPDLSSACNSLSKRLTDESKTSSLNEYVSELRRVSAALVQQVRCACGDR